MNELEVFQNAEFGSVRTINKESEIWFVAKDVCDAFGESNRNRAMQSIDEDEKGYTQMTTPGGAQNVAVVNESGLYALLFAMQPTKARGVSSEYVAERQGKLKRFKRWVTHEVLPSIRQHGVYATDSFIKKSIEDPAWAISVLQELQAKEQKLAMQQQIILEMKPKVSYYDLILQSTSVVSISKISKDYGMSPQALNKLLHELGVQYKQGKMWLLYQKYADQGYTQSKTHTINAEKSVMHTYWTQKGRLFLYDLLKTKKAILPMIERGDDNA